LKSLNLILPSFLAISVLGWGGAVPDPTIQWGLEDGMTDLIPSSHDRYHWYAYSTGLNDQTWDKVSLAVTSIDAEVSNFRWLLHKSGNVYDQNEVFLGISLKVESSVPPQCSDSVGDPECELGKTECLTRINNTLPQMYDVCLHYRVTIYWSRIQANNAARYPDTDPLDTLYAVTRHELAHVLGFRHGTGGPMANGRNPLTECQRAILEQYRSELEGIEWSIYVPEVCN